MTTLLVIPAQAGTQSQTNDTAARQLFNLVWAPASAGVTDIYIGVTEILHD